MTHHARLNLIMFATIAGLVVFLYFRPQSQDNQEYSIASGTIETVQNITIIRQHQEIALKRLNNHWQLIRPVQALADEEKVAELLQILTAVSQQRFPLLDLQRFGLDQPNVQLYLDDEYFGFGGFAPTIQRQYVLTGEHVFLISPRYALALPANADDLISTLLLAFNEIPVRFESNHLTIELQNENWRITTQHSGETVDEKILKQWIQLWQSAHAAAVTLEQEFAADFVEKGFIKISLRSGQEVNLKILQSEAEIVFLRVNEGIGYHFPIDAGLQLLDPHIFKSNQSVPEN